MESHLSSSSRPSFGFRLLAGVLALLGALQLAPTSYAQETTDDPAVVVYSRDIVELEGIIPFGRTYTFGLVSPSTVVPGSSVPVSFVVSPVAIPGGVLPATANSYVTLSPANPVFTGPNQLITITVTYTIPASATPGPYGMKIVANGFAGTAGGLINLGTFINASVSAAVVVYTPPVVNIVTPVNAPVLGSTITSATLPVVLPFSYTATSTGANASPITESFASLDIATLPAADVTLTGMGTNSVTGTGNLTISSYGTHTFTARATNLGGQATDVNTFSVVVQALPTVTINSPTLGASFNLPYGSASVSVPFTFTGNTPLGSGTTIKTLEAILYLNDGAVGTPITLAPGQISGTFGVSIMASATTNLAISTVGTHRLWVKTTNEFGEATDSRTFTVVGVKAPLTVTAEAKTKVYGTANPALTYTITGFVAGESLATSDVGGIAATSTTAVQFSPVLATGLTYPISVTQGTLTSNNYSFNFVNGGLAVTKALLTVEPDAILNKPFGVAIPTLSASITGAIAGDPNTPVYTGAPLLGTTASILSVPGTYAITSAAGGPVGGLASNNYMFDYKTSTLTISKGKIILTAASASKTYGSENPAFGAFTTSGAVAGDATPYTGSPSITCAATAASSVAGSPYAIVAAVGTMSSSKYNFEFVNGALAVNRAPLVISAVNKTKTQGTANPALTASYAGFVLGQTETTAGVLTTPVSLQTTAVQTSPVGSYPITPSGAVAPNYNVSYINGTLTVTESTPPPAQYTASGIVFFDINRNGVRNMPEDTGLGGICVKLYRDSALVASTVTAANGSYTFSVAAGSYEVDVIEIAGMTPTTADERTFTVTAGNVSVPDIGLGFDFCALQNLNGAGFSHGYWKNNLSKAIENKTSGTQETKANLIAWTNTIGSSYLLPLFNGMTMPLAVTTMSGTDQLKLQLLASEYNLISGRFINNSQPLTTAFIYWGEVVANNPSNYTSAYRTFVKNWMDAFNNSHGGRVAGPASY